MAPNGFHIISSILQYKKALSFLRNKQTSFTLAVMGINLPKFLKGNDTLEMATNTFRYPKYSRGNKSVRALNS